MTLSRVDVPLHFAPTVNDFTLTVSLPDVRGHFYRVMEPSGRLTPWMPVSGCERRVAVERC